jgi:hypothetical protein
MSSKGDHHDGGDFAVVLGDQTGDDRTALEMSVLLAAIEELAGEYGFKLRSWGPTVTIRKAMADDQARLDREDTAAMLQEFRRASDIREAAEESS